MASYVFLSPVKEGINPSTTNPVAIEMEKRIGSRSVSGGFQNGR